MMGNDVFEPISQRSRRAEDAENRRIQEIADELFRCCYLYEEKLREGQNNVIPFGFNSTPTNGRFTNEEFEVWDLLPRNVLKDSEGDIFVIDAEIKVL